MLDSARLSRSRILLRTRSLNFLNLEERGRGGGEVRKGGAELQRPPGTCRTYLSFQ